MRIEINCDLGEGFGRYALADDAQLMPLIDLANVACGFHASDPIIMSTTVRLAKQHQVRVGAHPSLPDRQGFGRREMQLTRTEVAAFIRYQIGALKGFLDGESMPLSHIKPHGALYGMACKSETVAQGICDAAEPFEVPLLGLRGTLQEEVYTGRGLPFMGEFYADLDYADDGTLLIGRAPSLLDVPAAAQRAVDAVTTKQTRSVSGAVIPIRAETICVHSDSGAALALLSAIREAMASRQDRPPKAQN